MRENKREIIKRKKIRKLLLLKINDELKQISKTKSNIMINSKTIQELNQIYNQNNILLFEKSKIYSNYIRTEETVISKNMSPLNITKTLNKSQSKNKFKTRIRLDHKISQFGMSSFDDDSVSPIKNFFPKKIELARNKFLKRKSKPRNNKSIIVDPEKHSDYSDKDIGEKKKLKSTKLGNGDLHLHKLIEKITTIKNNESTEALIIENIKKLRNYCYQLRKRKKRVKRMSLYKNNSFRKKSRDKEKKVDIEFIQKRNTKIDKHPVKESFFSVQQKMEQNYKKGNLRNEQSLSPSSPKFCKLQKKSTSKVAKFTNNSIKISMNPRMSKNKNHSSLKSKDKERVKKLQTLNEDIEIRITHKSHKKKNKKTKTEEKYNDENAPYLNKLPKEIMRSTINDIKMKFDAYNIDETDKSKVKYNKLKPNLKKKINKNMSIQIMNNKKNENVLKYFNNLNLKRDKIELHDCLNKSSQKIKKLEQLKKENEKKNEENEEIIKLKKLSIILDSRNNSKRKIFDSTDTRCIRYSNFSNYNKTNISNQITNDSNPNKSFIKKSKRGKI